MKVLIVLALAVASNAAAVGYHSGWWPAPSSYSSNDGIGNYAFGYNDGNLGNPSFHSQQGDASGRKAGAYGVKGADGNMRIVEYLADAGGYKANIKTTANVPRDHRDAAGVTTTQVRPFSGWNQAAYSPFSYYQ